MAQSHPDELLPWYVNGTLAPAERERVKDHLRECTRCRKEIALLENIQARIKSDSPEAPAEFGLNRLLRDIRKESPAAKQARPWWQPALAAAALVIVVQGAVLMHLLSRPEPIVPLGGPAPAGAVLQVRFQPPASEARIRALLQQVHAEIVSGPGALGVYRLRLEDAAAIERVMRELRAEKDIVAHVAQE